LDAALAEKAYLTSEDKRQCIPEERTVEQGVEAPMSSRSFFEARITTHQHGSSEIDYRAVHKEMVAQGFERVLQTTAQVANEVPGIYRLYNAQLKMAQVVEMIRLSLAPLGRAMAVRVIKIDEETLLNLIPRAPAPRAETEPATTEPATDQSPSSRSKAKAQSGYPAWGRPR
jgi:hypothetical protein